jgi:3-oxoacyl-[acyl-carrier protein] reductase
MRQNQIALLGRAAVVTGGARGIGFACARRLLACGARVALWDRDDAQLAHAASELQAGDRLRTAVVDVTNEESISNAARAIAAEWDTIDILINNAGITGPNKPTWDYEPAEWRRVIDIDLTGAYLVARALLPGMMANHYGRIVNIASVAGKEGNPNAPAYSAAKAGLIGLTKSMGKELAGSGVMVNCVTPAAAKTDLFDQMTPEHIAYMRSKIPMDPFVEPAEIAALVAWLCSEECSFSTGAVFDLSGGRATY